MDFKASNGWLFWFKIQHGFSMKKTLGEALDASKEGIERFSQILKDLIIKESLDLSQIYNTDKTSLFYHFWPMNTLDDEKEKNLPG